MSERDDEIYDEAAEWWQRLHADGLVSSDAMETWLALDPRHGEIYQQIEAAWAVMDEHRAAPEILALRSEALADVQKTGARRWGGDRVTRRALAASIAAAIVTPAAVWWFMRDKSIEYQTGTGEQNTLALDDNSKLTLDANSHVRIDFSRKRREVALLSGRAYFEVAKDSKRPFIVTALDHTVTAIGTAFSVESRASKMTVALVEGIVSVAHIGAADPLRTMKPGEELIVPETGPSQLNSGVDTGRVTGWRQGQLFFEDTPLAEAASRMNDYSPRQIEVSGDGAQKLRISGKFIAGHSDTFVEALKAYYAVDVEVSGDTTTIRARS